MALFVALLAYGVVRKSPRTDIDDALARSESIAAPQFELPVLQRGDPGPRLERRLTPTLADGRLSIRELQGTPVVLNFWASWCLPCEAEAPLLERTWRQAKARGTLFLGLDMQDVTEDARAFLREFGTSYPNVRDRSNGVARKWGVTGLPETFFVSREGNVVGHVIGAISPEQLRSGIAAAEAGQPAGTAEGGERRPTR